jgi:DNA repair protein RecO (recombination protein O)
MIRKDRGVVLRSNRSGETSTLVTLLGRDSGKVRMLGKGARSARSPFRGALEPGNILDVVYYYREGRTLFFVKEVHVHSTLDSLRASLTGIASVLAALELLDKVCFWGSPDEHVVDLAFDYLACKDAADVLWLFLVFEHKLLNVLGALPDFSACARCGKPIVEGYIHPEDGAALCMSHSTAAPQRVRIDAEAAALLADMASSTLADLASRTVTRPARKRLGKIMHWTYTFHVQGYSLPEALKLIPNAEQ